MSRRYPFNPVEKVKDLKELTDYSTRTYADKDAYLIMTGRDSYKGVTYRQFGEELSALANALLARGWAGERMSLVGENSYEWVLAYFAIVNTNSTAVPLDKELTAEELKALCCAPGVTVLFISLIRGGSADHSGRGAPGCTWSRWGSVWPRNTA